MKWLVLVLLCLPAFAQTSRPTAVVTGAINNVCMVDGAVHPTLASAVTCAGSSGVVEIGMLPVPALTGNVTIPSGVTLQFDGPECITTTGHTLTINGPLVAPAAHIFCGTGTVTGLSTVRPEWFGAASLSNAVEAAFASTGGTLLLQNATYSNTLSSCWTQPNVWFKGSGEPFANSGYTGLTGGTIIQGGLTAAGANNLRFTDMGFDDGSAFAGTSTADGLVVTGVTGCSSSSPADPLVTGTIVQNVSAMLSSGTAAFHAIRIEHNSAAFIQNVTAYFGVHGLTLKSVNSIAVGLHAYGQASDCMIMKSDSYTPTSNDVVSDVYCSTISSANTLVNGIILDAESSVPLLNINLSNIQIINGQNGLVLTSNGSGNVSGVNITGFTYVTNSSTVGLTQSVCVVTNGSGAMSWIHMSGTECINSVGALNTIPFIMAAPMSNSVFENTHTAGANGTGSVLVGTNIVINNWTATDDTSSKPFAVGASSSIFLTGYQGTNSLGTVGVTAGSTFNYHSSAGIGLGFIESSGILGSSSLMTVTTAATATVVPGSGTNSGLLRLRDNTSGGSAVFQIDPNGGAVLLGTSSITGITASAAVTFSASVWHVTIAAGGTFPRTLAWTIYD